MLKKKKKEKQEKSNGKCQKKGEERRKCHKQVSDYVKVLYIQYQQRGRGGFSCKQNKD